MPDKVQGLVRQPPQTYLAECERTGTRIVQQPANCQRNTLGSLNALVDFFAALLVGSLPAFEFQVRQDAEQRIVDLVCRSERKLRQRGELLVLGKLRLELHLLFGQLALFFQALDQLLLGDVALVLAMVGQFPQPNQFGFGRLQPGAREDDDDDGEDEAEREAAPLPGAETQSGISGDARRWEQRHQGKGQRNAAQDAASRRTTASHRL